jgi:hypothetical protein
MEANDADAGDTSTLAGACATVTDAEPEMPSMEAVIVAVPSSLAVTNPAELTAAQSWSDDDQVKETFATAAPFSSRAVAVSCAVSPSETSVSTAGVTTTAATVARGSWIDSAQAKKVNVATRVRTTIDATERMAVSLGLIRRPPAAHDLVVGLASTSASHCGVYNGVCLAAGHERPPACYPHA